MTQDEAERIARDFMARDSEGPFELIRCTIGMQQDDNDEDRRTWMVVFRSPGGHPDMSHHQIWIAVDDATGEPRDFPVL